MIFLFISDMTPKAWATKEKRDKQDFIKIKNFCASRDIIKNVKRLPTEWKEIFASHLSDKGKISKICKELVQLNNKKTNIIYPKKTYRQQTGTWKDATSLGTRQVQSKTTMRHHFTPTRMAIIKEIDNNKMTILGKRYEIFHKCKGILFTKPRQMLREWENKITS